MSVNRTLTPVMLVTPTWLFSDLSVVANIITIIIIIIIITIIIIIITLLISSKRLFRLIYNVKYLKLTFLKIPLKNAVLF